MITQQKLANRRDEHPNSMTTGGTKQRTTNNKTSASGFSVSMMDVSISQLNNLLLQAPLFSDRFLKYTKCSTRLSSKSSSLVHIIWKQFQIPRKKTKKQGKSAWPIPEMRPTWNYWDGIRNINHQTHHPFTTSSQRQFGEAGWQSQPIWEGLGDLFGKMLLGRISSGGTSRTTPSIESYSSSLRANFLRNTFSNSISSNDLAFSAACTWAKLAYFVADRDIKAISSSVSFLKNFAGLPPHTCQ